ncbi:MAG TPA: DciA family protein [Chitinolyticbacter sp.]|nr:DciA family protein [Chitinolyticbacter sp.]
MAYRPTYPAFIGQDRQLLQLVSRVGDLNRLIQCVRGALPPALAATCIAATLEGELLIVGVSSPAAAARIKQYGDALLTAVRQGGWQATAIRPRVQVGLRREKAKSTKDLAMSSGALAAFDELAATLDAGPLRDAVARLAKRHRRGRS